MGRRKKTVLTALIYVALLAACLAVVFLLNRLTGRDGGKAPEETLPQAMEGPGESEAEPEETATPSQAAEQPAESGSAVIAEKEEPQPQTQEQAEEEEEKGPPVLIFASDLHFYPKELTDYGGAFDKKMKADDGKTVPYSGLILDAFFQQALREKPDALVLSGDLTYNGERAGHERLAEKLRAVEDMGIPVLVIPGNHDINNPRAASYFGDKQETEPSVDREQFSRIYGDFGYDEALSRDEHSLSYVWELDQKNWMLMLDSCQYEPVNLVGGRIGEETLEWMEVQLKAAKDASVGVTVVAHHNLLQQSRLYPTDCTLENSRQVISLLEEYQLPLYVSGHLHLQRIKKYKPSPGAADARMVTEIVSSSLSIAPFQYGTLRWLEDGSLSYFTKPVDVEMYAKQVLDGDENIRKFNQFGELYLRETISTQIYEKLYQVLPEDQMEEMARLYSSLNAAYCAGTAVDAREVRTSEAYRLWERYMSGSSLFEEIQKILKDADKDNQIWEGGWDQTDESTPFP